VNLNPVGSFRLVSDTIRSILIKNSKKIFIKNFSTKVEKEGNTISRVNSTCFCSLEL